MSMQEKVHECPNKCSPTTFSVKRDKFESPIYYPLVVDERGVEVSVPVSDDGLTLICNKCRAEFLSKKSLLEG